MPNKPAPARSDAAHERQRLDRAQAEQAEVAGRHANSGQKDHKGARESAQQHFKPKPARPAR